MNPDINSSVSEKELQANVVSLAKLLGWFVYHTYDSRRCEPGFPDLVLVRDGRVIFAELKRERGRLTVHQKAWAERLRECMGVEVYVWRPSNWNDIEWALK